MPDSTLLKVLAHRPLKDAEGSVAFKQTSCESSELAAWFHSTIHLHERQVLATIKDTGSSFVCLWVCMPVVRLSKPLPYPRECLFTAERVLDADSSCHRFSNCFHPLRCHMTRLVGRHGSCLQYVYCLQRQSASTPLACSLSSFAQSTSFQTS